MLERPIAPIDRVAALTGTLILEYEVKGSAAVLVHFTNWAQGVVDVNFNVPDDAAQNVLQVRGADGGTLGVYASGGVAGYSAAQVREGYDIGAEPPVSGRAGLTVLDTLRPDKAARRGRFLKVQRSSSHSRRSHRV